MAQAIALSNEEKVAEAARKSRDEQDDETLLKLALEMSAKEAQQMQEAQGA